VGRGGTDLSRETPEVLNGLRRNRTTWARASTGDRGEQEQQDSSPIFGPRSSARASRLGSRRILRFAHTVRNGGQEALESNDVPGPATVSIPATQTPQTPRTGAAAEWAMGSFVFHLTRQHRRPDGLVLYLLRIVVEGGKPDRQQRKPILVVDRHRPRPPSRTCAAARDRPHRL
jgi:hypothetical protein